MGFHESLAACFNRNDMAGGNAVIMKELGRIVVHHRADFIDLIDATDEKIADADLVNLYFENTDKKETLIGTAFLVNMHNKSVGADGDGEVSNDGVIKAYKILGGYLGVPPSAQQIENREFDWIPEKKSEFWGAIVTGATGVVKGVQDSQYKKKYGALDSLKAQQQAKADLAASIMAERQAQIAAIKKKEAEKAKNIKIGLIAGGSLLAITLGVILYIKFKK